MNNMTLAALARRVTPDGKFLIGLYLGAAVSVVLPLIIFSAARAYSKSDNSYDWDQFMNGNHYNKNNNRQNNKSNGGDYVPWWWTITSFERRRDPDDEPIGLLLFLYFWTIGVLLFVVRFVHAVTNKADDVAQVFGPACMLSAYGIGCMLYLGGLQGGILDDGWKVVEDGWYGQVGVLLYMTLACCTIVGATAAALSFGAAENQKQLQDQYEKNRTALQERVRQA